MTIKVTVNPTTTLVSTVKSSKTAVTSLTFGLKPSLSLGQLTNVDASQATDGETLVYDAGSGNYIVKDLTITTNNLPNIVGGTF